MADRKTRQKEERRQKKQDEIQRQIDESRNVHSGDSPFSVNFTSGRMPTGSRDIVFNQVSVSIGAKRLFENTDFKFSAGNRYGLMGPNGRGKSTLLRLLQKHDQLVVQSNLDVLLVEQEQEYHESGLTAVEAVLQSHQLMRLYQEELKTLEKDDLTEEELERQNFLVDELDMMGAEQAQSRIRRILHGLGFPTDWHDRDTSSFSGGWRKRIALACAVFIEPDVLMLDEPTNHLDLNAVLWLEMYIANKYNPNNKRPKTLIVVSHDAGFLDNVCSHMVVIENLRLHYFQGSYNAMAEQVEQMHDRYDKQWKKLHKEIEDKQKNDHLSNAKITEWVEDEVRNGRIDEQFLERRKEYVVKFPFRNPRYSISDTCLARLDDAAFGYPNGPELFSNVNIALWGNSRMTLCGPNGVGKSTLLNLLTGVLTPTSGSYNANRQLRIGRYNQHFVDRLAPEKEAVEVLMDLPPEAGIKSEQDAHKLLGSFGLESKAHKGKGSQRVPIATLSGGQKARVAFALISAEQPDFLLLDEPTNHLDVEAIEALVEAIKNFGGGVLCVTHDSRLITQTDMEIWVAGDHTVKKFDGGLEDYRDFLAKQLGDEELLREEAKKDAVAAKIKGKKSDEEKAADADAAKAKNKSGAALLMGGAKKSKKANDKKAAEREKAAEEKV